MNYTHIRYEKTDGIGLVTLDRPERLNALTLEMIRDLDRLLSDASADNEVKVLLFSGAPRPDGRPCFCSGADIREAVRRGGNVFTLAGSALTDHLDNLEKPTIGAVDGTCTAGGLELVLAMDIRMAADSAEFSDMHMKNLGRLGEWGGQTRLCRAVGPAKAKEILWTGVPFDGAEAYRLGLVNRVVPHETLLTETKDLARTIAEMPGQALAWSKKSLHAAADRPLPEALKYERYCAEKAIEGVNPAEAPILKKWGDQCH
jgi:enoyl-CoA hydratase